MNARQFLLKAENKVFHTNDRRYRAWFIRNRVTGEALQAQRATRFSYEPKISILVPVFRTPIPFLREMIGSVLAQSYGRFELILANASPENEELSAMLLEYAGKDERIRTFDLPENGGLLLGDGAVGLRPHVQKKHPVLRDDVDEIADDLPGRLEFVVLRIAPGPLS